MERCTDGETVRELSSLFICLATHHFDPLDLAAALHFLNATTHTVSAPAQVVLQCLAASCQKSIDTFVGVDEKDKEYEVLDGTSQCAFLFSGKETRFSIVPADSKNSLFTHNKSFSGFAWVKPEANDQFPLQCVFVLLCKDKSASLHVTSSGSLHFMYLSESHIVYEALTETEKLIFNKWNFVAISYQKGKRLGKRTEFALFINGRRCNFQDAGSLKFPKTMFSELQIGNREGSDCLKGLISYMYFLSQPLTLAEVQQLFKLGVSYPGCFQSADVCHEHWHVCKTLDLHSSLVLGVSPRMHDSAGTPLPLTVLASSDKAPIDPLKRKLQATHVEVFCKGVKPVLTTKFITAAHSVGGLISFLPLLQRANGVYVAETLKLFSAFCSVPDTLTHREIMGGFCELLEAVLTEARFEESAAIDVIQIVDSLQWSAEAQVRALETLLLRYRIWTRVSWDTQRIILLNLFRLLSSRYREVSTRKATLRKALDLLAFHFARLRHQVGPELLKSRRLEVMELVRNELLEQTLVESEVNEVLAHMVYETKTSVDKAAAYLWLLRDLMNCHLLRFTEKSRSNTISALAYVLRRSAKKLNGQLLAEAIVLLRLVYGLESTEEEEIGDSRKTRSISVSGTPTTAEDSVVSALDELLPERLTAEVYKAVLGFLLCVPDDYAGKFMFEELLEENSGLKHKVVLVCITKRLQNADLEVISDFSVLCYHLAQVYERDEFPGWLLVLLRNEANQSVEFERRLLDLVGVIFCKAAFTLRNGCAKLRSLVHTLAVSDSPSSHTYVLRVLSSVCTQIDRELAQTDISGLGQKVYHNIHDLVYVLEDSLHLRPELCAHPAYLPLVKEILDLCQRLNLLLSTYPNLTLLPYSVLQRLHCTAVKEQVDWTLQRKREGGMLRVLLKLLLLAMHNCSDDGLQLILHYIHFVLAGGSAEGLLCSTITRGNKVQMYQMLSDYVEERLCRVLDGFPETEDDMLYSEKFLLLYVFVECSEQLMERVEKKLDATALARFLHSLLKHNKLGHHVNLFITKENAQSRQEYYDFLRTCGDRIRTTARQFYYRSEQLTVNTAVSHYRRSLGAEAAVADLEIERKSFIRKALKLMQSLNAAQDSVDQLYSVFSSPDYQTTLHMYLTVETSMKVGVVDHVLSSLPPPELVEVSCTPGLNSAQQLLKEIKKLEHTYLSKIKRRYKEVHEDTECERSYFRKRLKTTMKKLTGLCGLWEAPQQPAKFWKLDRTQDALQRSLFLKADHAGTAHEEAVNKKYQQTERRKRSFTDSIDDMEEEKKLLRSLSRLPSDVGEDTLGALSPVSRLPEGFIFIEEARIPCERISVKGSHFGHLELARNYLVFRSNGSQKPVAQFFGSALEWTAITKPCEKLWAYSELRQVFARRFNHQHTAVEFITAAGQSCLFNCFTVEAREEVVQGLRAKSSACVWANPAQEFLAREYTQEWRSGRMSNFEYLMKVNQFASRSFNDLNQYPVFPWVLANYSSPVLDLTDPHSYRDLSLPVGALDPDSEQEAKRRYSHWEHDEVIKPFHYGSHYCTAGIVLHYLVRLEPFTTQAIALQDGHFDVADRLFSSLDNAWMGSLKNSGDYKELVPEFFFLPEFLLNLNKYHFGTKQGGELVNDVQLPPWAQTVYEFVLLHRVALESRIVSENLNRWIDLIFGYKQQGAEAIKAANVFFYITYESNCKAFFKDDVSRDAVAEGIAEQIAQYGQTPVLLFKDPHPRRPEAPRSPTLMQKNAHPSSRLNQALLIGLDEQIASFFVVKARLLLVTFSGVVKVLKWRGMEVTRDADIRLEFTYPKANCAGSECQYGLFDGNLYSCGYSDGSFKVHEVDSGRLLASVWFHSSRVTCLCTDNGQLLTGGEDASLALWDIGKTGDLSRPPTCVLHGHKTAVKQCTLKTDLYMAASVDHNGEALVYSLRTADVRLRLLATGAEAVCLTDMGWACVFTSGGQLIAFSTCGVEIWRIDAEAPGVAPQLQMNSTSEYIVASSRRGLVVARLFHAAQPEKWRVADANIKCARFAMSEQCLLALEEDNSLFTIDTVLTR